jgi:hypothetical protein
MSEPEEKSLAEELVDEPATDTSTKRSRFSAFTLFFVVMVIVGMIVAAVLLYTGSLAGPSLQESMNSNSQ